MSNWIKSLLFFLKSSIFSLLLLLSGSLIQLYFLIKNTDLFKIEIGCPFRYFFFTLDGNRFEGANLTHFIYDFLIVFCLVTLLNFVWKKLKVN